jgi:hypothetical protein
VAEPKSIKVVSVWSNRNDLKEIRELAEIIKQDKYLDYNTDCFKETPANYSLLIKKKIEPKIYLI